MRILFRLSAPVVLALALGACSLGSLLGGGGKTPSYWLTSTPTAPPVGEIARAANAGETVTIEVPLIPRELDQVRVAAHSGTTVAYVTNLTMADTPDKLFQQLLAETVTRTTNRVVLSPDQGALDPGLKVTGTLQRFGYDASTGQVEVVYDAALSTAGGTRVETRRFTGSAPADGSAETVGPAMNAAANQVAMEAAAWIGG